MARKETECDMKCECDANYEDDEKLLFSEELKVM